jgi:hypothetical protein
LSAEEAARWRQIEADWLQQKLVVRRQTPATPGSQLHVFTDASEEAYGCAVYVLAPGKGGPPTCQLVYARSRLRPRKATITIPRMELLGVLIGVRALATVKAQLRLEGAPEYAWVDNKPVLHWLNSTEHQPVFVKNRLEEIRRSSHIRFAYVPTAENPADWCTRPHPAAELADVEGVAKQWWSGPEWLAQPPEKWPRELVVEIQSPEEKPSAPVAMFAVATPHSPPFHWVKWESMSSWHQWRRTFAYVRRFVANCKKKTLPAEKPRKTGTPSGTISQAGLSILPQS